MWDIMNNLKNSMCHILICCAYVDLNKFIDIVQLNQIQVETCNNHNFFFRGFTCIHLMKLHVASHQWLRSNWCLSTTIVLDVYIHCLKTLQSCVINYCKVMDGHGMAFATMTMLVTSGNKWQVLINYAII